MSLKHTNGSNDCGYVIHGYCQRSCQISEPRASSSSSPRPTTICHHETRTVELARGLWRRQVCCSSWRTPYRNGLYVNNRRPPGWEWVDQHLSRSRGYHTWKGRCSSEVLPCQKSQVCTHRHMQHTLDTTSPSIWRIQGGRSTAFVIRRLVHQAEGITHPQFDYWYTVWKVELLLLVFVRSLRECNFHLYLSSLSALAPCFFALDHTHYSRWLPVHIRDMVTLRARVPDVAEQFSQGKFVVQKTSTPFSAISVDNAHEQIMLSLKALLE